MKERENTLVYSVQEVAKLMRSSPNYVYNLINRGYLPAIKLGSVKILKESLNEFLKVNEGNDLSDLENIRKINRKEE